MFESGVLSENVSLRGRMCQKAGETSIRRTFIGEYEMGETCRKKLEMIS
jgi:hypothetical protein